MKVGLVVLAAGQSPDLTSHQQLMEWESGTLLDAVLDEAREWPVDERFVVLGNDADAVVEQTDLSGFVVVIDEDWINGPLGSLRIALDHITREPSPPDGVLIALASQPNTPVEVVEAVVETETHHQAVVPVYRYERGYPLMLDRSGWDRVLTADDQSDLLRLLESVKVDEVRIDALPPRLVDSDRSLTFFRR